MIIVIEQDQTFFNMLQINISSKLPLKIIQKDNASEALAMMEVIPDVKIVICRPKTGKEETAKKIIAGIKENELESKVIVLEQLGEPTEKYVVYIPTTSPVDKVTSTVISLINKDGSEKAPPMVQRSYFTIPFALLKLLDKYPADLYLKIKKGDLNDYLKLFNCNEDVDFSKIDHYIQKGAKKAYVKKEDGPKSVEALNLRFKKILNNSIEDLKDREQVESVLLDNLEFLGLNKSALKIAQNSVNQLTETMNKDKKLVALIGELYNKPGSYKYRKSFMTALFCSTIAKHETSIDSRMIESLSVASFLNDFILTKDEHINVRSEEEFNQALFTKDIGILVDKHASNAAEQLSKISEISEETIKIVRQHHGTNLGVGFKYELPPAIGVLSEIFILSEELAIRILNTQTGNLNLTLILKEISALYKGKLDRFIDHLKKSFAS